MKSKLLLYFIWWLFSLFIWYFSLLWNVYAQGAVKSECSWGIKLNTDFPLVGNCIELKKSWTWTTNTLNAFPTMVWALMRIIASMVLVVCFIMIIMAWIKRSANDPKAARDLIKKVAITILLLWLSGVILKVINPTFFW